MRKREAVVDKCIGIDVYSFSAVNTEYLKCSEFIHLFMLYSLFFLIFFLF